MISPFARPSTSHGSSALAFLLLLIGTAACGSESATGEKDATAEDPVFEDPVFEESGGATVVRVEGALDAGTLALLTRAIGEARDAKHGVFIVDLDTPGGEIETMWKTGKVIRAASGPDLRTVAWVHDNAISAGVLVALACDRVYMTRRGAIGAATPITIGPQGVQGLPEEGGVRAKMMSAMRAQFRAWAEDQGRSGLLAEAMIDNEIEVLEIKQDLETRIVSRDEWDDIRTRGEPAHILRTIVKEGELLTLTGDEATRFGFADGIAETLPEVLSKMGAVAVEPTIVVPRNSEDLLRFLDSITPLLILAGLALAWTELKMPGFGLPGILAVACFAIAFAGRYMVGLADFPHLVIVSIGFALIAIELFAVPGTLWFGLGGGILVLVGLLLAQLGPGFAFSNPLDREIAYDESLNMLISAALGLVIAWGLVRFLPDIPLANRMVSAPTIDGTGFAEANPEAHGEHGRVARVGEVGVALTALRPVGKVRLEAAPTLEYEARSLGELIDDGARIEVIEVEAGRLVVESRPDTEPSEETV